MWMTAEDASQRRRRLTVLISGQGTNLQALLDASRTSGGPLRHCHVTHVISNRSTAYGLERARQSGIATHVFALKPWLRDHPNRCRTDYDIALAEFIRRECRPHLVVLAGWMHILSAEFLRQLGDRVPIVNVHPALPGCFDGANAIARAWDAHQRHEITQTGVMVHRVTERVDGGDVIVSQVVPMADVSSLQDLEDRMHAVEHVLIVQACLKLLPDDDHSSTPSRP